MSLPDRVPAAVDPFDLDLIVTDTLVDASPEAALAVKRWHPETPSQAEWAMRKLGEAAAFIKDATDVANEEHARIAVWLDDVQRPAQRVVDFFTPLLTHYALDRRAEFAGSAVEQKTTKLPSGEISTRSTGDRIDITDLDRLLAFLDVALADLCAVHEAVVAVKRTVRVGALGKWVRFAHLDDGSTIIITPDGEPVPGVEYIPADVSVTVKPRHG